MANKTYLLPDGSTVTVNDEVSLLGPDPNVAGCGARNSNRDLSHQPIQFWTPRKPMPKFPEGYGITQEFLDEWNYHNGRS